MTAAAVQSHDRFQPDDRLRCRSEFERVYAVARKAWGRGCTVFVAEASCNRQRLGLAVGRRVGNAVLRNRIKRRIREVFRLHRKDWPGCYDIVVHGRAEVAVMPFQELTEVLTQAVRTAVARKPRPHRGPRERGGKERSR
ncbi:MAG: ribonuclease P protein component [Acidobacteria bacterium]|nr:ribonuclease P protein component [Acidobacteriota bacterium]